MLEQPQDRAQVMALLRRHGWNATSFQILEDGFRYWFDGPDACVAYADTGRAWVAAGAPIADEARLGDVAHAFVAAARRAGRRACFFGTERRFAPSAGMHSLAVGQQPVWDPGQWPPTLRASRSLREQLRRARAKGVTVRALGAHDVTEAGAPARRAVDALIARWLGSRPMAPMGFLVGVQPFSFAAERRYFVAERAGRVVGFLAAVPIYGRDGWLFEDLPRDADAPNGTTELLIDAAMRDAADAGSRYVTLGLAPLAGPVAGWMGVVRDVAASLYDFRGLHAFRARLRPQRWDAIGLSYVAPGRWRAPAAGLALYDALSAFARGRVARFALETLRRRPAVVSRRLARRLGAGRAPWPALPALRG